MIYKETFGSPQHNACLLIAGAMEGGWGWSDTFCKRLVEAGFYVIRYDHRDIGRSSVNREVYEIEKLVKDVIGILDDLNISKAHLVGHSMGGHICQEAAFSYPERVRSICAIASGPIAATEETEKLLSEEEKTIFENIWKVFLSRKDEDGVNGYLEVYRHLSGSLPMDESMALDYIKKMMKYSSKEMLQPGNPHEKVMQKLTNDMPLRKGILKKITVPALIIHGEKDPLCLPRYARSLADELPNGHFHLIKGMGHMFFSREIENKILSLLIEHMKGENSDLFTNPSK
jgi:pimeloyl-ACP methyl ester carboxylesterase